MCKLATRACSFVLLLCLSCIWLSPWVYMAFDTSPKYLLCIDWPDLRRGTNFGFLCASGEMRGERDEGTGWTLFWHGEDGKKTPDGAQRLGRGAPLFLYYIVYLLRACLLSCWLNRCAAVFARVSSLHST